MPIVAPRSPGDCFDAALEAVRIAITYRTPVMLLSDGSLANGSEPWKVPDVDTLPTIEPGFATEAERPGRLRGVLALPARRRHPGPAVGDPRHPGAGAPHRRPGEGRRQGLDLLRAGQPRPHGPAAPGQDRRHQGARRRGRRPRRRRRRCSSSAGARRTGPIGARLPPGARHGALNVAQAHLRHLNPLPANLGEVLARYRTVLLPEMNLGPACVAAARPLPGRRQVLHQRHRAAVQGRGDAGPVRRHSQGRSAVSMTELGLPTLGGLDGVPTTDEKQTAKDFTSDQEVRWCPGCGDYAVLAAVRSSCPTLGSSARTSCSSPGIGCSSRFPYYLNTYGMHSIHGRAPTVATGLAVTRPDLSVWVVTGDGDALSIGGNHLIHALRRNVNLTILLFNNRIYGLTKGQYSPTSEVGKITKSTPIGSVDHPFNPVSLALGRRGHVRRPGPGLRPQAASPRSCARPPRTAVRALVEIFQDCPIFNDGSVRRAPQGRRRRRDARRPGRARRADPVRPGGRVRRRALRGRLRAADRHRSPRSTRRGDRRARRHRPTQPRVRPVAAVRPGPDAHRHRHLPQRGTARPTTTVPASRSRHAKETKPADLEALLRGQDTWSMSGANPAG